MNNQKIQFHKLILEYAREGRALDAVSDGWEMLDFAVTEANSDQELKVWDEVAHRSNTQAALISHASADSFATAVISARGGLISVDPNFALWLGSPEMAIALKDMRDLAKLTRSGRPARRLLYDFQNRPILVAGLQRHNGLRWPLSPQSKNALANAEGSICLVAFAPTRSKALQDTLKAAFRLSTSEAKLAVSLVNTENLEEAAEAIGISEATANGYRKSLFKKMQVKRRSELVNLVLEMGHRERCGIGSLDSAGLQSTFGLKPHQMDMLDELALGLTIPEAAKKLALNIHTARDLVRSMFEQMGVNKQSELVRVALEYRALVALSEASEVSAVPVNELLANTRIFVRPEGGLVYLGDYGPKNGIPILLFHAGLGTRRIFPEFLKAANARGLRIICIERPGFGGTDLRCEPGFFASSLDAEFVLDKLGIQAVSICSISGGNVAALEFAAQFPERVLGGLLVNPTPPKGYGAKPGAPASSLRQMTFANPKIVRAMINAMRNQMRSDLLDPVMDRYFSSCVADKIAFANPVTRAITRASTQAALARTIEGFVREEEAFVRDWRVPKLKSGNWAVAIGLDDHSCDAALGEVIWKDLPGLQCVGVANAGRLIMASRPDILTDCLLALSKGERLPQDQLIQLAA